MKKFIVILRQGSPSEKLFLNDCDGKMTSGNHFLTCETFDTTGNYFARAKRIPAEKNQDGKHRSHQVWWIAYNDIVAVFEYDNSNIPAGFCLQTL
ncbi:MAG: hypothetical protein ABFD75_12115 [Smithella sp.]